MTTEIELGDTWYFLDEYGWMANNGRPVGETLELALHEIARLRNILEGQRVLPMWGRP